MTDAKRNELGQYVTKYDPSYCGQVIDWMIQGKSLRRIASLIGVDGDTVHAWRKAYPEFQRAVNIGYGHALGYWEDKLEECVDRDKSCTGPIFTLKTRFWREYKEAEVESKKPDGPQLVVTETYEQYIKRKHEEAQD